MTGVIFDRHIGSTFAEDLVRSRKNFDLRDVYEVVIMTGTGRKLSRAIDLKVRFIVSRPPGCKREDVARSVYCGSFKSYVLRFDLAYGVSEGAAFPMTAQAVDMFRA